MEYAGMEPTSNKSSWEDPFLYNIVEEDQTSNPHRDNSVPSRHIDTKHKSRDQEASPYAVSMLMIQAHQIILTIESRKQGFIIRWTFFSKSIFKRQDGSYH